MVRSILMGLLAWMTVISIPLGPPSSAGTSLAHADEGTPNTITGQDGAPLVLIPAGPFPMGVPPGDRDGGRDEYPRHEVMLDAFYLDKFEVTNGQYIEFVRATNHRVPQHPRDASRNLWEKGMMPESVADRPVINVDWHDADAYCRWAGRRLPTEAEWEKAARGEDDRRFPWGNVEPTPKHLNYLQKWMGEKTLMPVGSYEAGKSPYGVHDMAGNVWEWVNDWYDAHYYEKSPAANPPGPQAGKHKVLRSSSWAVEAPLVRAFTRVSSDPLDRNESTGFRCAKNVKS